MGELSRPRTPELVSIWAQQPPSWLKIIGPKARLPATAKLDDGEADAISLAKEIKIQDLLIDERRGRTVAQRLGLIPLPTLTVLERAAELDLLDLAKSLLALQSTNFRLPQAVITDALARDAARKNKPNQPP